MEFLEIPLVDDDIFKLIVRFAINLVFLTVIVRFAIYPSQRERDFAFTAVMMNVTVFFICFSMKKLDLGLGMALGLFAIFGVLRYRTDAIRAKEMTYLFIVIGVAVINALSNTQTSYLELFVINIVIFITAILKERIVSHVPSHVTDALSLAEAEKANKKLAKQRKHTLDYDKLDWLAPQHRESLISDIRERTGIDVARVQIENIDLRSNSATITIWYDDPLNKNNGSETVD